VAIDAILMKRVFGQSTNRKTKNLLLQPGLQLKLPLYVLMLTFVFAGLSWVILYQGFQGLYEFIMLQGYVSEQIGSVIKYQTNAVIIIFTALTIVYVVLVLGFSIVYLHRLVGPTIAFRRHIGALAQGNYAARSTLRKHDAFWEVAQDLNDLAASLEQENQAEKS